MGFFGKFKKENNSKESKKGFFELTISSVEKLTTDTVKVSLEIPDALKPTFHFIPGQYLNLSLTLDTNEEHRAYSICSGPDEPISFAVKAVKNGKVSIWFNETAKAGQKIFVSKPQGNFILKDSDKNIVAIAAGSGITPIVSIAKALEKRNGHMNLFYGNRTRSSIIFEQEIAQLEKTKVTHFLSNESLDNFQTGRIDKESFTDQIKANLDLLKADAFFLCGPEQMIIDVTNVLKFFGVAETKIHFELFTTPVLMKSHETSVTSDFKGESKIKAILDGEIVEFTLNSKGKNILEAVETAGLDAPYSCKGGVCCSCKAKILKGSAVMTANYSLTEEEIHKGYILTCQSHPTSEELTITFDE